MPSLQGPCNPVPRRGVVSQQDGESQIPLELMALAPPCTPRLPAKAPARSMGALRGPEEDSLRAQGLPCSPGASQAFLCQVYMWGPQQRKEPRSTKQGLWPPRALENEWDPHRGSTWPHSPPHWPGSAEGSRSPQPARGQGLSQMPTRTPTATEKDVLPVAAGCF